MQNTKDYLDDDTHVSDDCLPLLFEFDVLYYFEMDSPDDTSEAKGKIPMS